MLDLARHHEPVSRNGITASRSEGQLYAPAVVTSGKGHPVPLSYEAGWDPDLGWTIWKNFTSSRVAWSLETAERMEENICSV
jgi:hypothetical protein